MGMRMFGNVAEVDMIKSYSDLKSQTTNFSVMTLNTILANKLGLLVDLTRNEPRDLFDIWFLLQRRDKFDFDFSQVCDIFKQKYSFRPAVNILFPRLQGKSLRQNWNTSIVSLPPGRLWRRCDRTLWRLVFVMRSCSVWEALAFVPKF